MLYDLTRPFAEQFILFNLFRYITFRTGGAVLTARELEVLRLLALGHTNSEIAARMYISPRTVETHRANIQRKLGVSGRPELVRYALGQGLLAEG